MTPFDSIFDEFWTRTVPVPFSMNAALKARAKVSWNEMLTQVFQQCGSPEFAQSLVAIHKIGRILMSARVIAQDPDPDPEKIAAAVQTLIDRMKVSDVTRENTQP